MSELFFVIKTALFSVLLLMTLQMKVGRLTLEQHSEKWIYESKLGNEMQIVARGALKAGHEGWSWIQFQTSRETSQERFSRSRPLADDLD
jgi:hypothetical protein